MSYMVFVEGLSNLKALELASKGNIQLAAQRAINRTADTTRTASAREIRRQVNFPAQYLTPSAGRLAVSKRAGPGSLEAIIKGQHRATSLARFVTGSTRVGKAGVTVQVQPGVAKRMSRAFLIRLPHGSGKVDTKFNLGLAIRLKPGERLQNKKKAIRMARGLYLLYGPSVDQVFQTVASDVSPEAAEKLEEEFLRLLEI